MIKFWSIARNTFVQTIRQPIFGIMVFLTFIMLVLNVPLSGWTMGSDYEASDQRMLENVGLSTLLLMGMITAVFCASSSISKEIEDKYRREAQESDLNPDRLFERIYDQVPCAKIAGTKGAKGEKLNARTLHKAFRASNGDIVRIFGGLGLSADQEGEDVVAIERMIHSVEFIQ